MTKKDYELIAEAINSVVSHYDYRTINNVMHESLDAICTALENDNNKFDRTRFLQACGIGE